MIEAKVLIHLGFCITLLSWSKSMSHAIGSIPPALKQRYTKKRVTTLFSDEDSDLALVHWWLSTQGYASVSRGEPPTFYHAHRVVMERVLGRKIRPKEYVDHRNRNRLDNRRCNLALVDKYKNAQNTSTRSNNTSGVKGVYLRADTNMWTVDIQCFGKRHRKTCGCFAEAVEYATNLRKELNFYNGENP